MVTQHQQECSVAVHLNFWGLPVARQELPVAAYK